MAKQVLNDKELEWIVRFVKIGNTRTEERCFREKKSVYLEMA